MKNSELLSMVGLSRNESLIYLSLVENGPETVSGISRASGVHRPAVYKTLPELLKKGLIAKGVKRKQQLYMAENPGKVALLFEQTKRTIERDLIPELKSVYHSVDHRPVVKFLEGKDGIQSIFLDLVLTLKRGAVFYRYSGPSDLSLVEKYLPEGYRELRDQKNIERFVITSERIGAQKRRRLERDMRFMPHEKEFDAFNTTKIM